MPRRLRTSLAPGRVAGWGNVHPGVTSFIRELPIVLGAIGLFYGVFAFALHWSSPIAPQSEISLNPAALPKYALFSVLRIAAAYFLSLVFTLIYGYVAAYNRRAERLMVPLLDTLQSIPVLSFLPPVMISMVALFPSRELGVELGSVLLIFTGQVWNMTFSFYSSLKSIPGEMREAAIAYRLNWWQRFWQLELPYGAIGLIWNSMMSVAGGWFFLMACEMFVLGSRDFRLPGLGSYLQTAANAGDKGAIAWGLATMVTVIILIDQFVWRPVIAWAEKFKLEQVPSSEIPRSPILSLVRGSELLPFLSRTLVSPVRDRVNNYFQSALRRPDARRPPRLASQWTLRAAGILGLGVFVYAVAELFSVLRTISFQELRHLLAGAGATFLRVEAALVLAALWTIPVGVAVGLRPRLSALAQPIAQIAASVPATALFPIILLILVRAGGGLGIGSILLLLLGTQWYVLFNVIAGASAIPADLKEVCDVYALSKAERWRKLLLPGIFPYLITGLVTASGGAWNASIVAEYFHFRGETMSTLGLGAIISEATDGNNFRVLLAATVVMAIIVVSMNRLVWRRLYVLARTRFRLEA
ncbi:MAG: ABC transporter permease subunit [Acidobacteria bacterium]|nr:ABC transporter permease subunit [Acidobacteriota bacterium]